MPPAADRQGGGLDPRVFGAEGDAEDGAEAESRVGDAPGVDLRKLRHCVQGPSQIDHALPHEADPELRVESREIRARLEQAQDSLAELGACPLPVEGEVDRGHRRSTAHPGEAGDVHVVRVLRPARTVLGENQGKGTLAIRGQQEPSRHPVTPARELEIQLAHGGRARRALGFSQKEGDRLIRIGLEHRDGAHGRRV